MANLVVPTFSGRSIITNRLKGNGTEPKNIGWGDSAVTASANPDVNLFGPQTEARVVGTSSLITTTQLADTYQVTGQITALVGAKTIREAALFDSSTLAPTTTVGASMTAAQASIVTGAVGAFPTTGNYYAQLENEVILITGANSTTLTCTRGRIGSTSAVHSSGVPVTLGGDGGAGTGGATSEQTATVGAAQGGSVFIHGDFAGIALSVSDAINFTFKDQFT